MTSCSDFSQRTATDDMPMIHKLITRNAPSPSPWNSHFASPTVLTTIKDRHNPASMNKRSDWVNDVVKADADGWLAAAEEKKGSWWTDWATWIKPLAGDLRAPRKPGNAKYKPVEPAPGRYVKERAV